MLKVRNTFKGVCMMIYNELFCIKGGDDFLHKKKHLAQKSEDCGKLSILVIINLKFFLHLWVLKY